MYIFEIFVGFLSQFFFSVLITLVFFSNFRNRCISIVVYLVSRVLQWKLQCQPSGGRRRVIIRRFPNIQGEKTDLPHFGLNWFGFESPRVQNVEPADLG